MKRLLAILALAAWWSPSISQAQTPAIQKEVEKKLEKQRADEAKLEDLIAEALKNNPDIHVAEAKARESEAELRRVRLHVAAKVSMLHSEIHAAGAGEKEGYERYKRAYKLYYETRPPAIAKEDLGAAELTWQKLRSERIALEAKLPYLLGRPPGAKASAIVDSAIARFMLREISVAEPSDDQFIRRTALDVLGRVPTAVEMKDFLALPEKDRRDKWIDYLFQQGKAVKESKGTGNAVDSEALARALRWLAMQQTKASPMADKVRKSLDAPMTLKTGDLTVPEVLEILRKEFLPGVNVISRLKVDKTVKLKIALDAPIPLGAFLQYIEDELDCVFILRDYGIVVVSAVERRPPDALRVIDFWKRGEAAPKTEPKTKTAPKDIDLPAGLIRGVIEKADNKNPLLMQISIGSSDGVVKGKIVEVYLLLRPDPKYAVSMNIRDVTEHSAAGFVANAFVAPPMMPRVGEQVAFKVKAK